MKEISLTQYVDFDLALHNWESFTSLEKTKTKDELNFPQYLRFHDQIFGVVQANARDSMVFNVLDFKSTSLVEDDLKQLLPLVTKYLAELWGGKVVLLMPKDLLGIFESIIDNASGFTLKPNATNIIYFSKEALISAFANLENEEGYSNQRKQRMQKQQKRFKKDEIVFLDKTQIVDFKFDKDFDEMLYHFLANNAGFVYSDTNVDKLKIGLYSPAAMKQRRELDPVELFVAYDKDQQQILHSAYVNIIMDPTGLPKLAYISDIVARGPKKEEGASHLDQRDIGLSEVFFQQVYDAILQKYPSLQGAFLIAGGNGLSPRGRHLNLEVFHGMNLNPGQLELVNNQQEVSPVPIMGDYAALIRFFPMNGLLNGPLLVKAANRDAETGKTLDAIVWPNDVLEKFTNDKETAKQLIASQQGALSSNTTTASNTNENSIDDRSPKLGK